MDGALAPDGEGGKVHRMGWIWALPHMDEFQDYGSCIPKTAT
ncbi:hypothetical protein ACFYXF_17465 [Streptomyces sp. NPDC002680]